jgi:hypothetical protein
MQRRPTLTPSTVTPPSLSAQTSSVSRTERTQPSPDRASALLAKVASNPTSRKQTPLNSPLPSPAVFDRSADVHRSYAAYGDNDEVARKAEWSRHMSSYGKQQQGKSSFPVGLSVRLAANHQGVMQTATSASRISNAFVKGASPSPLPAPADKNVRASEPSGIIWKKIYALSARSHGWKGERPFCAGSPSLFDIWNYYISF